MNAGAIGSAIVSILLAIIGVAIIAVLVSKQAQTAQVLSAGGQAFSGVLGAALSPVTGSGIGSTLGGLL
jgi:PRD1 phage membrane DNA delivery